MGLDVVPLPVLVLGAAVGGASGRLGGGRAHGEAGGIKRVGHVGMDFQAARIVNAGTHRQSKRQRRQREGDGDIAGFGGQKRTRQHR